MATILQEMMSIECHNTCLIWLSNICEDNVNEREKHSVFVRVSGVFDDGYEIN